jgi:hypothetical protein
VARALRRAWRPVPFALARRFAARMLAGVARLFGSGAVSAADHCGGVA